MAARRLTDEERAERKVASDRRHYALNKERIKARVRAYKASAPAEKLREWSRAHNANYYRKYSDAEKARALAYRKANIDEVRAKQRAWGKAHPEKKREQYRGWSERNKEKERAIRRAWLAAHPEKKREYRAKLAKRAAPHCPLPLAEEQELREWFGGKCAYCLNAAATSIDHVMPFSRGGEECAGNYVPACKSCNSSKGNATLFELLMKPGRLVTRRMVAR